jgi:general secretion pathway protein G
MWKQIQKVHKEESGFTLIELLIVIVILGVLAGIVVFAVGGITDRGQNSACASDQKNLQVAIEAYIAAPGAGGVTNTYPADNATAKTAVVPKFLHSYPDTTMVYAATPVGGPFTSFTVAGIGNCAGKVTTG